MTLRLDANLRWLYTEWPVADRMAAAAADGFRGVEIAFPYDTPAPRFHAELQGHGLHLVQVLSPLDWEGGERGLVCMPGRQDDFARSVHTAIAYALESGRPLIHPALGNVPAGEPWERCYAVAVENLRLAADAAAAHRLTLIVEACCTARFPAFLLHSIEDTVRLIEAVGRDNLKLCFDTYHVQMESGELAEPLARAWPHIGHVQLGSTPGRHEPGEGEIDFPAFLDALERRGWSGWVGLEYTPRHDTRRSLDWARSMGLLPAAIG